MDKKGAEHRDTQARKGHLSCAIVSCLLKLAKVDEGERERRALMGSERPVHGIKKIWAHTFNAKLI